MEFYDECAPPRYHFVLRDNGHLDMLDDGVPYAINNCMCMRNLGDTKEVARRTIGGLMVAFLRDALEDQHDDLKLVLGPRASGHQAGCLRFGLKSRSR